MVLLLRGEPAWLDGTTLDKHERRFPRAGRALTLPHVDEKPEGSWPATTGELPREADDAGCGAPFPTTVACALSQAKAVSPNLPPDSPLMRSSLGLRDEFSRASPHAPFPTTSSEAKTATPELPPASPLMRSSPQLHDDSEPSPSPSLPHAPDTLLTTRRRGVVELPDVYDDDGRLSQDAEPLPQPTASLVRGHTERDITESQLDARARLQLRLPGGGDHLALWDVHPQSFFAVECDIFVEQLDPARWDVADVGLRVRTASCPSSPSKASHTREYADWNALLGARRADPQTGITLDVRAPPRVCAARAQLPVPPRDAVFALTAHVVLRAREERQWVWDAGRWVRADPERAGEEVTLECESVAFSVSTLRRGVDMDL